MSAYTCDQCRLDGGWHYDEDGNATRCENRAQTALLHQARELAGKQQEAATEAARQIVTDAAERLSIVHADLLRDEIAAAQLEDRSGVMGAAFTWAARNGHIEWTGETRKSTWPKTKGHRILVYRSLRFGAGRRAAG